jgi:hypothetical protein
MWCTDSFALFFLVHLLLHSGKAEVTKFDVPILVDKHVGTLEVTMENLPAMQVVHAKRNVFDDLNDPVI